MSDTSARQELRSEILAAKQRVSALRESLTSAGLKEQLRLRLNDLDDVVRMFVDRPADHDAATEVRAVAAARSAFDVVMLGVQRVERDIAPYGNTAQLNTDLNS